MPKCTLLLNEIKRKFLGKYIKFRIVLGILPTKATTQPLQSADRSVSSDAELIITNRVVMIAEKRFPRASVV